MVESSTDCSTINNEIMTHFVRTRIVRWNILSLLLLSTLRPNLFAFRIISASPCRHFVLSESGAAISRRFSNALPVLPLDSLAAVALHSIPGITFVCFQSFSGLYLHCHCTEIRTVAHKTRTKFLLKFVRDIAQR